MNDEQVLAEVEELLRICPPLPAFKELDNEEALRWLGRTAAVLSEWDDIQSIGAGLHISALQASPNNAHENLPASTRAIVTTTNQLFDRSGPAYRGLRTLLYQAQHDLRAKTVGPFSVAIQSGKTFDYFDEIRKITEMARDDLLFVDPYLDAEFVSIYLPQIRKEVTVRLLTSKKLPVLLPAVKHFVAQNKLNIQVRSASAGLHDRYVFVDKMRCYQSGASFKDGARRSPTTLTQITDAFETMYQTYQRMWNDGRVDYGVDLV